MAKKTYEEKLYPPNVPKIVELCKDWQKLLGVNTMVVPKPTDIYEIMKSIPEGKVITVTEIREILAHKYNAGTTCPWTTGIFLNICANASVEIDEEISYHRTLRNNGELNPKYPNAYDEQIAMLQAEGFEIIQKGKKNIKYFVKDYEQSLIDVKELTKQIVGK